MKRLALFCDGTWNSADQEKDGKVCPTNVVKLAQRVANRGADGVTQCIYYDQGVGTGNSLDRFTGGAFGKGLDDNLWGAYRFLVLNYEPGDEIFLFGFSRGAYTARSLGGMVRKCGILRRDCKAHYRDANTHYCDQWKPTDPFSVKFRQDYARGGDVLTEVKMIGVWDTVGALGVPVRGLRWITKNDYEFHDVELSSAVRNAFQALAIDERRAPFEPARWAFEPKPGQKIEQVWFPGVHSDIGGGYAESGLSDITLKWMRDKAESCGLAMDPSAEATYPIAPNPLEDTHNSKKGLYRVTPGSDRVLCMKAKEREQPKQSLRANVDPTQHLHPSVLERWDQDPHYRPDNLLAYFKTIGDPRANGAPAPHAATAPVR